MLGSYHTQSTRAFLDAAVIDLGNQVFEEGKAYFALSRVRTLDGVVLLDLVADKDLPSSCTGDGPTKG